MPNIVPIQDLGTPELDIYIRLTGTQLRNKLEPEKGIFIAESPTVISVALKAGYEPVSMLTDERLLHGAVTDILEKLGDIPVYTASRDLLRELTGFELTRGALCAMRRKPLPSPESLLANARRVAILEAVTDSTNIGAVFRSAAALNIDAVLLTPTCCDPLCRRALRVSMGTVLQVPFARLASFEPLKKYGFQTLAMALSDNARPIDDPLFKTYDRLAIVLGTEGDGLASATIAACDHTVKIPMSHGVDSLNVAAAGALAFWELRFR